MRLLRRLLRPQRQVRRHPPLPSAPTPSPPRTTRAHHPWFYDPRFDGHFPSRILPFVYLGNLNHASNALGITHVVSMGDYAQ
ncbi:hypothetical protein PtB15_4B828 [Puccinia triticina]|nr:hypothetical protein PtB15_4B828 [Puccinia triticina]